jgi:hypothetical protein
MSAPPTPSERRHRGLARRLVARVKLVLDRAARIERDQRRRGGPMMRERAWPR